MADFYRVRYFYLITLLQLDQVPPAPLDEDQEKGEGEVKVEENPATLVAEEVQKQNCQVGNHL